MGGHKRSPNEFFGEVSIFDTKTGTCKKVVTGEDIENPRDNGPYFQCIKPEHAIKFYSDDDE